MSSKTSPRVSLPNGAVVTGAFQSASAGDTVQVFRGIPYAEPPVGDRRWTQATLNPISTDLDATAFGSVSFGDSRIDSQSATFRQSEDCLFLNVYAPATATAESKLSVLVYIHGGVFSAGASNAYDGSNIITASGNKIVYVSINYRLSVFGFLSNTALRSRGTGVNFGLRDQQVALQWIQQYIEFFGGNPKDVTLFGHSAGAKSVMLHMLANKGTQQLFHKAIIESGAVPSAHDMPTPIEQAATAASIASTLGFAGAATDEEAILKSLQAADADELFAAARSFSWSPVVDGIYIEEAPVSCLKRGGVSPIPDDRHDNRRRLTEHEYQHLDELYPATSFTSPHHRISAISGDAIYESGSALATLACALRAETYRFHFRETSSLLGPPLAFHGVDLPYIFSRNFPSLMHGASVLTESNAAEQTFVKQVQTYWTNFILTGSPNGSGRSPSSADAVPWPAFDVFQRQYFGLQSSGSRAVTPGTAATALCDQRCAFWIGIEERLAGGL